MQVAHILDEEHVAMAVPAKGARATAVTRWGHGHCNGLGMSIVKNVCLATDLSEHSLAALEIAIDVSLARHAGLTLLYVHETALFELPAGYVQNLPSELDRTYDELNRRLAQLERKARSAGVTRVEKRIVQGVS